MHGFVLPQYFNEEWTLILDTDGVLTDGAVYWDRGKIFKKFGPDDNEALQELREVTGMKVRVVSGDRAGVEISRTRAKHMGLEFEYVPSKRRWEWFPEDLMKVIYMGDGYHDWQVFKHVAYGVAPADAWFRTRIEANHVTRARGGQRAVAELADWLIRRHES